MKLLFSFILIGIFSTSLNSQTLDEIISQADVISFHLPLTTETNHFANTAFFSGFKKKPVLLNTSRGKVIDTTALLTALEKGFISAAGLDVLENENLSSYTAEEKSVFQKLAQHDRVLMTPHIAGYSTESFYKVSSVLLEKLGFSADISR